MKNTPEKATKTSTSHGKRGVKSHAGVPRGSVIAAERDQQLKRGSQKSEANSQTEELGEGQRNSDGQREDYNSNTASELNRQS